MEAVVQDSGITSDTQNSDMAKGTLHKKVKGKVLPPCKVCAAPGTGFHYGVTTCEPCKVGHIHKSSCYRSPIPTHLPVLG